jgi:hypothetical protein
MLRPLVKIAPAPRIKPMIEIALTLIALMIGAVLNPRYCTRPAPP